MYIRLHKYNSLNKICHHVNNKTRLQTTTTVKIKYGQCSWVSTVLNVYKVPIGFKHTYVDAQHGYYLSSYSFRWCGETTPIHGVTGGG